MNNENNNSNFPLVIIGLVLVAAIIGGWWLYTSSKAQPNKSNTNSATTKKTPDEAALLKAFMDAPAGAQPPNTLGSPTATVTVEEFADYQCPTCASVHPKMQEITKLYQNRIKFIYRSFPLQMHKNAYDAAAAAEAAGQQGRFWEMQTQLFTNQQAWANSTEPRKIFEDYAQKIGLDVAKFQNDMLGLPVKTRIAADMERGRALNIGGTPTIYINGRELPVEKMEVTAMRQIIDAELQKASSQPQPNQPTNQAVNTANQSVNNSK